MKQAFYILLTASLILGGVQHAYAQTSTDLSVTPVVIDEKAKARDILKETITVRNTSNHVLSLYPSVDNINPEDGEKTFSVAQNSQDLSDSLANWIELSRGVVQLGPGEEKSIPFIIRLNLNAVPGMYHAQISLTEGITRAAADARPPLGVITVNLELQADIKEILQLDKFSTDNIFFSGDDIMFKYQLDNIGNQELQPKGQVHIYDRTGKEVATVDANKDGKTISPDQISQLASVWSGANGFGRYKAMLTLDYGSSQTATVQDTVFFWIIPWKQMLAMFTASLVAVIVLALYFHRWLERRHLYKFAHAGLLNDHTLQKIHSEEMEEHIPHPVVQSEPRKEDQPATRKKRFGFFRLPPAETRHIPLEHTQDKTRAPSEHRSLREVLQKETGNTAHSHSIDLRQLRAQREHSATISPRAAQASKAAVHGHVISLKKTNE